MVKLESFVQGGQPEAGRAMHPGATIAVLITWVAGNRPIPLRVGLSTCDMWRDGDVATSRPTCGPARGALITTKAPTLIVT